MTTIYYYKGTPFMYDCMLPYEAGMKGGKEQIALGLRLSNLSLEEQATIYLAQLDMIENSFVKHSLSHGGNITKKVLVKVAKEMNMSIDKLYGLWCVNICSLLIMKKLENDDMNGTMVIGMNKKR
jgi:hypothetical protein